MLILSLSDIKDCKLLNAQHSLFALRNINITLFRYIKMSEKTHFSNLLYLVNFIFIVYPQEKPTHNQSSRHQNNNSLRSRIYYR